MGSSAFKVTVNVKGNEPDLVVPRLHNWWKCFERLKEMCFTHFAATTCVAAEVVVAGVASASAALSHTVAILFAALLWRSTFWFRWALGVFGPGITFQAFWLAPLVLGPLVSWAAVLSRIATAVQVHGVVVAGAALFLLITNLALRVVWNITWVIKAARIGKAAVWIVQRDFMRILFQATFDPLSVDNAFAAVRRVCFLSVCFFVELGLGRAAVF